jgi:hexosaminidase
VLVTACIALCLAAGTSDSRPPTIPALRSWRPATGSFVLHAGSRLVVDPRHEHRLASEANLFAGELRRLTGRRPPIVVGGELAAGDIQLALGSRDRRLGREGYRLEVGPAVRVGARADAGVFYATRTLLQLLRRGRPIPAGVARDWPRYPERGLMIDNGRKYFTVGWIKRRIRELAYLKLNHLHLHLSDNQGFRIESDTHPEIVSREHLTKKQVRAIVALASRYHVRVVPEIDMPSHLQAALAAHPGLQLESAAGVRSTDKLDVALAASRRFVRELITEYLPLFPGRYWHGGADEYLGSAAAYAAHPQLERHARERYGPRANGVDAYLGFINWIDRLVRRRGKTLRVWHDGLSGGSAVTVGRDVVVEWWADHAGPRPRELLARGHRIMNAGWYPTYYVNGVLGAVRPGMRGAYESWAVHRFHGLLIGREDPVAPPYLVGRREPRNLGSKLNVWNDEPERETEQEIERGIAPRLRVIAQKTWNSPMLVARYDDFLRLGSEIGHAPVAGR